ncbi:MAG: IS110 family transposase [Clostridiales bacterium]|nr:IS110 family transposase [Clostridiales bacterium]
MQNALFVGIDVSLKSNAVCVLNAEGKKLDRFSVHNDRLGSAVIVSRVCSWLSKVSDVSSVHFGVEATSNYGHPLLYFLKQDHSLTNVDTRFFILNPRQVRNFKKAYSDLPKTDPMDAFVIADCLRFGRIGSREAYMDDFFAALQRLTRSRLHVAEQLAAEKNRYTNALFLKFSGMAQEQFFSNNFGATAMALIEHFDTVDDIAYTSVEELAAFLNKHGKGKFADPDELARTIQAAARASYRLPSTVLGSVNQVLAVSTRTIRFYETQLKDFDKAIADLIATVPNPLTSIPGIGAVYSAGIIAEVGNINRFSGQAALAKFAGLAWSRNQSGEFDSDHTAMIHSGNRYLRYYLIEAANKVRQHDPDYAAFYAGKLSEAKTTPHKRALVLTARKLVRLVYALLRDNKLYTPPSS